MKYPTLWVLPDEKTFGLFEGPRKGRWIQAVYVLREDTISEWVKDYGPASDYKDIQTLVMPSAYGEDTVAQLQEIAEKNRHDTYWADRVKTMKGESTLIADVVRQDEEMHEQMVNRSTLGPHLNVQRSLYSQAATKRRMDDRRTKSGKRIY